MAVASREVGRACLVVKGCHVVLAVKAFAREAPALARACGEPPAALTAALRRGGPADGQSRPESLMQWRRS